MKTKYTFAKKEKSMENQFWKYVLPSMITVLLGGTYAFIDGIFIGQGAGDVGLTAVNIAAPAAALITALSMGVGLGGSILMTTYQGAGDKKRAELAKGNTITLTAIVSVVLMVAGLLFSESIVRFLGGSGETLLPAIDYLKTVLVFGCFQMFSSGLSYLVVNSGKTMLAMFVMVVALVTNIVLDAYFVLGLQLGTYGAALATVMGQAISAILYLVILLMDKKTRPTISDLKPNKAVMKSIIKSGISPFGTQLAPSIVLLMNNWACNFTNGAATLATFAVMSQIILAVQVLFTGIGNGIQPIISYCSGAKRKNAVRKTLNKALILMSGTAVGLIILLFFSKETLPSLFGASTTVAVMVQKVMIYFLVALPMMGFVRVMIPYFFASSEHKAASILTYLEPFLITPVCLVLCCSMLGADGIWIAMVLVQFVMFFVAWILYHRKKEYIKLNLKEKNLISDN